MVTHQRSSVLLNCRAIRDFELNFRWNIVLVAWCEHVKPSKLNYSKSCTLQDNWLFVFATRESKPVEVAQLTCVFNSVVTYLRQILEHLHLVLFDRARTPFDKPLRPCQVVRCTVRCRSPAGVKLYLALLAAYGPVPDQALCSSSDGIAVSRCDAPYLDTGTADRFTDNIHVSCDVNFAL